MDDLATRERRAGGDVEPLDRGYRKDRPPPQPALPAERFELRDPRSDLTYRVKSFFEMVAKANQLGATRFTAIAPDGTRSTVSKTGGTWRRDDLPAPMREPQATRAAVRAPVASTGPTAARVDEPDANAEQAAKVARIEAALNERYVIARAPIRIGDVIIGQTEYRHRGDTSRVAFTESTFRLSTETNSPSVARSMVDVAEARRWQALRISGNEEFRRMVWLEASLRSLRTIGYEPVPGDQELLRKVREAREINRIEPLPDAAPQANAATTKQSERGSGGRKAVLAALEAVLVARNVPERQRQAVMAAAAENLAARAARGETHRLKIYDKAAPSQRPTVAPVREAQRDRERGAPAR